MHIFARSQKLQLNHHNSVDSDHDTDYSGIIINMGMIITKAATHVAVLDRPFDALCSCFIELVSVAVVRIDDDS